MSTTVKDTTNSNRKLDNLTPGSPTGNEQSLVSKRLSFFEEKTVDDQVVNDTSDGETNDNELQSNSMFIICVNGVPKFNTQTLKNARLKMWETANQLLWESYPEYNGYIHNNTQTNMQVIGSSKSFLISYDRVLHDIVITKIPSLD